MKRIALLFVLLSSLTISAQRMTECLNFGWEFRLNDEGEWRKVNVPHDFQIEQPWVAPSADEKADNTDVAANIKSRLSSRGFKEMGKGYYRLHYTPAKELEGQRVLLDFEGIMYTADVYLNHKHVGGTNYGYVGFEIDVTNELDYGKDNLIEVVADTREPNNSRWYTGGGLFRNVRVVATPKDRFFNRHPLYITTRDNRFVSVSAEFTNRTKDKATAIRLQILDPDGKEVYSTTTEIARHKMTRHQEARIVTDVEIADAKVWDIDSPYLYRVKAQLLKDDGAIADETCDEFGFRTIEFGPDFGLKLNGHKVLLKGYANHHTLGALGAAAYPKAIEKRLKLIKQFGMNHIRTSHNPYSRDFIRLCDKYGILVVDELYDKWTRQHTGGKVAFDKARPQLPFRHLVEPRQRAAARPQHAFQRLRRNDVPSTEDTASAIRLHASRDGSHASPLPQLGDRLPTPRSGNDYRYPSLQLPLYVLPWRRPTLPLDEVLPKRGLHLGHGSQLLRDESRQGNRTRLLGRHRLPRRESGMARQGLESGCLRHLIGTKAEGLLHEELLQTRRAAGAYRYHRLEERRHVEWCTDRQRRHERPLVSSAG